ncbi:MipA/OmpV family protein [Methylobacterium pseudosasicola]|uniref:Outer membrane scaffolding protein for murein synthesis, MipA/OmpV family n=1 Tax=Methylobacterium pseudosasicola TaxID=582667 RepID=A0A1I4UWY0_9HYPH|nr:MipA/OmpV family protein [Methylobacterium pseudosasicola]SFM93418.1 Outer membrane scaffolding protein for murein synthesis, MipA/OmpV family [Methylobacterium pseudosasicola]
MADDLSALFDRDTIISAGGFVGSGPRFQGSRQAGFWGLPYLSFRKADEPREWWSPDDGLDVTLVGEGRLQAGAVLDFREGRFPNDDRRLAGLPRLPATVGLGLFGEVWPIAETLRLRAEVTQGIRAHDGLLAKLGADLVGHFGRFTLSAGPRLVLGDAAAMQLDFDVPVEPTLVNPRLTPYRASAGARSAGATATLSYAWSEAWQTLGYVRYDRLIASASGSPIVRRIGTADELTVSVGAIYSFRANP